jgi:DNA-binding GntR family transcriptional regulator
VSQSSGNNSDHARTYDHARVYNELKAMVINYRFRPGEQLLIGELADRLHVSSTPIREALIRLQTEGLLDPAPRRGFFAKTLHAKEMIDLYECGFLILKQALERNVDAFDIRSFEAFPSTMAHRAVALTDRTEELPETQVRQCAHYLEHIYENVVALSENEVMISTVRNIIDRTHYVRLIGLEVPQRFGNALHAVDEFLTALQERDVGRAVATLERELNLKIEIMPALIREGVSRTYTSR